MRESNPQRRVRNKKLKGLSTRIITDRNSSISAPNPASISDSRPHTDTPVHGDGGQNGEKFNTQDQTLNVELAKLMGWTDAKYVREDLRSEPPPLIDPQGNPRDYHEVPLFTSSLDAHRPVWAEIERRGLKTNYLDALAYLTDADIMLQELPSYEDWWLMMTATPLQHTRAAIAVLGGGK